MNPKISFLCVDNIMNAELFDKERMYNSQCVRKKSNFTIPAKLNLIDSDYPQDNVGYFKKFIPHISPKLYKLFEKIKELDNDDMRMHGKKFKHFIFTDIRSSLYGAKIIGSGFINEGFTLAYTAPRLGNPKSAKKFGKIRLLSDEELDRTKYNNFYILTSAGLFTQPIDVKTKKELLMRYNERPNNVYGKNVRFIIMDSGYKEGIDLFDIKYIHIFEPQTTMADLKQVIGRGTRLCGQKGLPFDKKRGWELNVFIYDVAIPKLLTPLFMGANTTFELYLKAMNYDVSLFNFQTNLQEVAIEGAVDYPLNKNVNNYSILDAMSETHAEYDEYGYEEVKGINLEDMSHKMNYDDVRSLIDKYYKRFKWDKIKIENGCISNEEREKRLSVDVEDVERFANGSKKLVLQEILKDGDIVRLFFDHNYSATINCDTGKLNFYQNENDITQFIKGKRNMRLDYNRKYVRNSTMLDINMVHISGVKHKDYKISIYSFLSGYGFNMHRDSGNESFGGSKKRITNLLMEDLRKRAIEEEQRKFELLSERGKMNRLETLAYLKKYDEEHKSPSLGSVRTEVIGKKAKSTKAKTAKAKSAKAKPKRAKSAKAIKANSQREINPNQIITYTKTQDFVRHFFIPELYNRGILLWHSVGTGKTCTAIATATTTFEPQGYTILWVTRTTLVNDIWKNMFSQICSESIRDRVINEGLIVPDNITLQKRLLSPAWKIKPISYKQFTNLVSKKNDFYKTLVKINGSEDPLRKTLLIIDEAHKLYGESDLSSIERPNMEQLHSALMKSYEVSGKDSVKLMLMTATPITKNPMELIMLLNLCKKINEQLPTDYYAFKQSFLTNEGVFSEGGRARFLDEIAGYISYLDRSSDVRQFSQPKIKYVMMDSDVEVTKDDLPDFFQYDKRGFRELANIEKKASKIEKKALTKKLNQQKRQLKHLKKFFSKKNKEKYEPLIEGLDKKLKPKFKTYVNNAIKTKNHYLVEVLNEIIKSYKALLDGLKENPKGKKLVTGGSNPSVDDFEEYMRKRHDSSSIQPSTASKHISVKGSRHEEGVKKEVDEGLVVFMKGLYYNLRYKCSKLNSKQELLDIINSDEKLAKILDKIRALEGRLKQLETHTKTYAEIYDAKRRATRDATKKMYYTTKIKNIKKYSSRNEKKIKHQLKLLAKDKSYVSKKVKLTYNKELKNTIRNKAKMLKQYEKERMKEGDVEYDEVFEEEVEKCQKELDEDIKGRYKDVIEISEELKRIQEQALRLKEEKKEEALRKKQEKQEQALQKKQDKQEQVLLKKQEAERKKQEKQAEATRKKLEKQQNQTRKKRV